MLARVRFRSRELHRLVVLRVPLGETKLKRVDSDYLDEETA